MAEAITLETNSSGELRIPAGVLGAGPGTRFRLEQDGQALRLIPESPQSLWETLPPDQRARTFRDWVARLPKRTGDALPAETLRREKSYN
ncbi:MAG: hypothetical protein HY822_02775 [Acidobacteria bacterium]|nr:hypothetical protein [Acidobacteriota bacterium]